MREEATIVNIDILNLKRFEENENAIDVALPVWILECEATPPVENHLDAYEKATLKLVGIGLSAAGIANTLNATQSLVEDILASLENKEFVKKDRGRPWQLTDRGEAFLNGSVQEKASEHSVFGLMFVNAIRKNVFPYFYEGDVDQISLFNGYPLPEKLTIKNNEAETFDEIKADRHKLKKAFRNYWRNRNLTADIDEGTIGIDEAISMFEGLDAFDEEYDSFDQSITSTTNDSQLQEGMFVRALNKDYHRRYIHMQIIIDPRAPGGYRIESPFDQSDIDAQYFLREVQWMRASGEAFVGDTSLNDLLESEIRKINPTYGEKIQDCEVFVLRNLYKLYALRETKRFKSIYKDFEAIYPNMEAEKTLLDMEHIVSDLSRLVVEALYNLYFEGIPWWRLEEISDEAQSELRYDKLVFNNIMKDLGIDTCRVNWGHKRIRGAVSKLATTKGNSSVEKLINIIVLDYYCGLSRTKSLLSNNAGRLAELTKSISNIRNKVSHDKNDTKDPFSKADYSFFMDNVFDLINMLLEPFGEEQ